MSRDAVTPSPKLASKRNPSGLRASLRRVGLLARRDFIGYVKTLGFWITVLSPFLGLLIGGFAIYLTSAAQQTKYVAVLDDTGRYAQELIDQKRANDLDIEKRKLEAFMMVLPSQDRAAVSEAIDEDNIEAARDYLAANNPDLSKRLAVKKSYEIITPPEPSLEAMTPFINGQRSVMVSGQPQALDGLLYFYDGPSGPVSEYWTTKPNDPGIVSLANRILRRESVTAYFGDSGLSREGYNEAFNAAIRTQKLNPAKTVTADGGGQNVTAADSVPYIVAAAFSAFLWFTVFSGAYMLLMSMVEEKINKALEMLLASTRFTEILFGKLLGVAMLTITTMAPWLILGGVGLVGFFVFGDSVIASAIKDAISFKLLSSFIIFFILGYIFYGALFMALGSLAESMQDAQTLVTPILLLLTFCVMVVPMGLEDPDSGLVRLASFIPFSAPFAILVRLPADPPLWEILLSGATLLVSAIAVVWLSARMFRYGVLSGGGVAGLKAWFTRVVLRRKAPQQL